jgi:hypothetical protein
MEKKLRKDKIWLFPNYFKRIGIATILLAFIPLTIFKLMNLEFYQMQKEILKILTMSSFLLGFVFIAWSKDKIEDEMSLYMRFRAISFAFGFVIIYVILNPIFNLIFQDTVKDISGQNVVLLMLWMYLIWYYLLKRGR